MLPNNIFLVSEIRSLYKLTTERDERLKRLREELRAYKVRYIINCPHLY